MGTKTETYLTVSECVAEFGVPEQTIRSAIAREKLMPVIMYGRQLIARREWERYRAGAKLGRPIGSKNKEKADAQK